MSEEEWRTEVNRLDRRVARLERALETLAAETGAADAVREAEEVHQEAARARGNETRQRLSELSRRPPHGR
jgi:hypothetical protein